MNMNFITSLDVAKVSDYSASLTFSLVSVGEDLEM